MTQFSSRPPFNDDPLPWCVAVGPWRGSRMDAQYAAEAARDPRPEFDRPQTNPTNPILAWFRTATDGSPKAARYVRDHWEATVGFARDRIIDGSTIEHEAHASRVIRRLARPSAE